MPTTEPPLVHGPVQTARMGRMLVFDLCAPRDHMVVARDSTIPRASVVVTTAAARMMELSKAGEKLDSVLVVGSDADPTDHPELREITENLRSLRDKWFSRAKLCIQTRVTELDSYELRVVLGMYDRLMTHYEWGTAKTFSAATGAKGTALAGLTKHLGQFEHLVVQAAFYTGEADNSKDTEVRNWIKRMGELRPQEVHILTGKGFLPPGLKVKPITKAKRQKIADELAEKTGLAVSIHEEEEILLALA